MELSVSSVKDLVNWRLNLLSIDGRLSQWLSSSGDIQWENNIYIHNFGGKKRKNRIYVGFWPLSARIQQLTKVIDYCKEEFVIFGHIL